ncbi:unnamed protein product [Closterium sp. Naga37s-1]|nr:unnamed protein product [Closterium sp. Naga37s-1]
MSFNNVIGGKLKLKGGDRALPSIGGIKKKKKKTGKAVNLDSLQLQALRDAEAALKEEEARGGAAGLHESGAVAVGGAGGEEEGEQQAQEEAEDLRTPAERRYHEQLEKLEAERAARGASKSHRQRVEDFNKYLANLSEHHDIPKGFSLAGLMIRWVLLTCLLLHVIAWSLSPSLLLG